MIHFLRYAENRGDDCCIRRTLVWAAKHGQRSAGCCPHEQRQDGREVYVFVTMPTAKITSRLSLHAPIVGDTTVKAAINMHATTTLFAIISPDWNSLESVRRVHSDLAGAALAFFAPLVLFDVLAHFSDDKGRERLFEKLGLCFFAVAVVAEIVAYPFGQRNDTLSEQIIGSLDA